MKIVLIVVLVILGLLVIALLKRGKGKPIKLLDENGNSFPNGLSTREKIMIGGVSQYVFITSENVNHPVLLFLHGGPGSSEIGLEDFTHGQRLEEKFTVCYWEQRGAGLSYGAGKSSEKMTVDLMVTDAIELTEYLMKRFDKDQIYIMGHSWGTFLGTKVISKKPEYYKAYFGIGQISNQKASEKIAYHYMLEHAEKIGDVKAVNTLKAENPESPNFPSNKYLLSVRTNYMNKYGVGLIHSDNFKMSELVKKILAFKGYSFFDILKYPLGSQLSSKMLFPSVIAENLMETETQFELPIYILQGAFDMQVSYSLAKDYSDLLLAPKKGFYTFKNSAHSPNLEEKELFLETVFTILENSEK